jgi:hypothetical protein
LRYDKKNHDRIHPTMSKEEVLLGYWHNLLPEQQSELIHFAEFLQTKVQNSPVPTPSARPNIKGLCSNVVVDLTLEDFTQARQEIWATFPREDFYT